MSLMIQPQPIGETALPFLVWYSTHNKRICAKSANNAKKMYDTTNAVFLPVKPEDQSLSLFALSQLYPDPKPFA